MDWLKCLMKPQQLPGPMLYVDRLTCVDCTLFIFLTHTHTHEYVTLYLFVQGCFFLWWFKHATWHGLPPSLHGQCAVLHCPVHSQAPTGTTTFFFFSLGAPEESLVFFGSLSATHPSIGPRVIGAHSVSLQFTRHLKRTCHPSQLRGTLGEAVSPLQLPPSSDTARAALGSIGPCVHSGTIPNSHPSVSFR